jgi:hypothetical protein
MVLGESGEILLRPNRDRYWLGKMKQQVELVKLQLVIVAIIYGRNEDWMGYRVSWRLCQ